MEVEHNKKRILVAPLNWGLGHATRCIPIIKALMAHNFEPLLASDGAALHLLQKEFPELLAVELPSYQINYPKNGKHFKLKMLQGAPKMIKAIHAEKKAVANIISKYKVDGIISDNRLGVQHKSIPCVFITHQLQVLSGRTTWLTTKLHQNFIQRFEACWVPDCGGEQNLSGNLGHQHECEFPITYIGPLSRFQKQNRPKRYDVMVLLSGPEPQRTLLETQLLSEFKTYKGHVLFVKGCIEDEQYTFEDGQLTIVNFMTSEQLEQAINESALIVSRSGYTTIMDLSQLGKKAFFIPTPGQFEQEYLAKRLTALGFAKSCNQDDFSIERLSGALDFKGFTTEAHHVNWKELFGLF